MAKQFIRNVKPYAKLYRDTTTGIAWIEDGSSGCGWSVHSNIDITGSVRGMKYLGYWGKKDRTVRSHGYIYNLMNADARVVVIGEKNQIKIKNNAE